MTTIALQENSFIPIDIEPRIDALLAQSDEHSASHAETVVKGPGLTVTIVVLRSGASMHEHAGAGDAVLIGLRGWVKVHGGPGSSMDLRPGQLLALGAESRHRARAEEDSAFLLVLRHG